MTNAYGVQSFVPLTGEIVATWKDVKAKEFLAYQNAIFITTENVQSNLLELHKVK